MNSSRDYIRRLHEVLDRFPHESFDLFMEKMARAYDEEQQIFVMGNGGSGSTASHWVCDINKGCCEKAERKFRMICLNDNLPSILAWANDTSYEEIFVAQLKNFLRPGDLVIGISGSGNSENILKAIRYAKVSGADTVGLCGYDGGQLAKLADIVLLADVNDMQLSEDMHMICVHISMQHLMGCNRSETPISSGCWSR